MFVDLHLHTTYSDSTLTPEELVSQAKALGIGLISICDHNTVAAYPELSELCAEGEPGLLPGVEIDCYMGKRYVHLLGYGFDLNHSGMLALLSDCAEKMQYQNDAVILHMARDYSINIEEYTAYVSPPEIGGYKNSNFLLHKGIIQSITEYFPLSRKYGVAMEDIGLPEIEPVCAMIKEAGGVPVLAHPWDRLDRGHFVEELQTAYDFGVMGIECFYPSHDASITRICLDFCKARDLYVTAGSDAHGLFNRVIDGIVYEMGRMRVDMDRIDLKKLMSYARR